MNIYFSGIGGVGIGALASIAHSAGYGVFGSDQNSSLIIEELSKKNIEIEIGRQNGDFLKNKFIENGIDWFVYTAALPKNHPELLMAKKLGIKISKRDELLNEIITSKNLKLVAISGTHGKTTTTGMVIWIFKQLGIPMSWSIGTTISFGESGFFDPQSEYFIYEADEFDRNFLHFTPAVSLITSIDHDHTDIYKTEADYFEAFSQFGEQSDFIISWKDQHPEIFKNLQNKVILNQPDEEITLPGIHNRKNASLAVEALDYLVETQNLKVPKDFYKKSIEAINNFPGTNRRFERITENIYSDYGHHPKEIQATLQMAKEIAEKKGFSGISLIYQPHQNVRQIEVQDEYTPEVFENANEIIWLPTYLSRENPDFEILSPELLSRKISEKTQILDFSKNEQQLLDKINQFKNENRLILAMSAGSLDGWIRKSIK